MFRLYETHGKQTQKSINVPQLKGTQNIMIIKEISIGERIWCHLFRKNNSLCMLSFESKLHFPRNRGFKEYKPNKLITKLATMGT